ncbi:hypothetical protein P3T36_001271 [Kitasatospora sp. MAP12-15]|uniref:hypothetical protein n=1 Tax=unclassified Kitasatospora TaxID=2633591 RepID=UPI0024739863|nr:hypothetical protein [Kitasatospora sp. MAP12-44]MDH6114922.1 hypothetical protein [Kitasatospora sp. MAP12-44]
MVLVALAWLAGSLAAAAGGLARDVTTQGWWPTWGLGLYVLVQAQIGLPLIRDLVAELRPSRRPRPSRLLGPKTQISGPKMRTSGFANRQTRGANGPADGANGQTSGANGMLPRRWPEALAVTAALALTALLASGWVSPMLPWLG